MSTPYWGQLPPPQVRRLSESSEQADRRQSLDHASLPQPRCDPSRASGQSAITDAPTESTYTSFASPTTSNAPGGGLTPRPPSFSRTQNQRPQEPLEYHRAEESRDRNGNADEFANASFPPPAPDVPRAPPISYRHPYGSGGPSYTYNSAGQPGPPHLSHRLESRGEVAGMELDTFYNDVSPRAERQVRQPALDRADQEFNNGVVSPEHLERELVKSGSVRRPSNGYRPDRRALTSPTRRESLGPESQQRMWAADRSPLQKLELTLDNITKEEKRARVEAAERRARERAARVSKSANAVDDDKTLLVHPSDQQVRPRGKPQPAGGEQSRYPDVADPSQAIQLATTAHAHGTIPSSSPEAGQQYRHSGQAPRSQIPTSQDRSISATTNGIPQRNLSFRERAATQERTFTHDIDKDPSHIAQTASFGGNHVPVRTTSNKLRKNPPTNLWLDTPKNVEQRSAGRSAAHDRPNPTDNENQARTQPFYGGDDYAVARTGRMSRDISSPTEDLPRPPARGKTFGDDKYDEERPSRMRGLAAAIGFGRSNSIGANRRPSLSSADQNAPAAGARFAQHDRQADHTARNFASVEPSRMNQANQAYQVNQDHQALPPAKAFQGAPSNDRATKSVKFQDWEHESETAENMSETTHQRHRLREYLHHDGLKPGQGTFRAPTYLDEWKQGMVGLLSGPLLELSQDSTLDKSTAWWESNGKRQPSVSTQLPEAFIGGNDDSQAHTTFNPPLFVRCGPLLRYCGIRVEKPSVETSRDNEKEIWRGSVMIVTIDSDSSYDATPLLRLFVQPIELLPPPPAELSGEQPLLPEYVDPIAGIPKIGNCGETLYVRPVDQLEEAKDLSMVEPDDGLFEVTRSTPDDGSYAADPTGSFPSRKKRVEVDGEKLGKYTDVRGFRLHTEQGHTFWRFNIEVELRDKQQRIAYRINGGPATGFWVPARGESMNIMFHSCNGFSQSVNPDEFSGPDPMWRDVLNVHQTRPFHVMIGGGDQVYNDAVANQAKLFHEWIAIKNPLHKSNAPFTAAMQAELEVFYLERYMMWFSQGLFGLASSQIPMVNMYDDHDIIDGFGSYPHHFMKSPVFSGLGNVAFKYYMLFQHQSVPDETESSEPSWCLGVKPGPYIHQRSRSLFVSLGARVALLAVDARTERTRDEVVHSDTWRKLMDRCYEEIVKGTTQHLLVLLGVPIAYPRLVWLENM